MKNERCAKFTPGYLDWVRNFLQLHSNYGPPAGDSGGGSHWQQNTFGEDAGSLRPIFLKSCGEAHTRLFNESIEELSGDNRSAERQKKPAEGGQRVVVGEFVASAHDDGEHGEVN